MERILIGFLLAASVLLPANIASAPAPVPDGTLKITTRKVSPGIGLSWGDGVLTYKGQDYPFMFEAKGLFRNVDANIAAAELSGQVFNLKRLALFDGSYRNVEANSSAGSSGSRATIKNLNGVVIHLVSTVEGRKFVLGRDGIKIQVKKQQS